jgi:hypothetical protein
MLSYESRIKVYQRFCGLDDEFDLMGIQFFSANFGDDFDGEFKGQKLDNHKSFEEIKDCVIALLMTYKVYDDADADRPEDAKDYDINHSFTSLLTSIKYSSFDNTNLDDDEKKFYKKMNDTRSKFSSCLPFVDPTSKIYFYDIYTFKDNIDNIKYKDDPNKLKTFYDSLPDKKPTNLDLDVESFLLNAKFAELYIAGQSKKSKQTTKLDDLTFFQDKKQEKKNQDVYRDKNEALINSDNDTKVEQKGVCAAIGSINTSDCANLLLCLNSGNPEQVAHCLSNTAYKDVFEQARTDIKTVKNAPKVAVKILEKFGVKAEQYEMPNGQKVIVPVTKNTWFSSLTPEAKTVLNSSPHLKEYINALIDHIRANPALTNKNYTGNDAVNVKHSFIEAVGALPFKLAKKNRELILSNALVLSNMPTILATHGSAYGLVGGGGCGSNVRMSYGGMEPNVSMSGGCMSGGANGTIDCSNAYRSEFKKLKLALHSVGLTIDNTDESQVEEALKKIDNFHKSFARVHEVISYLVSLRRSLGLNNYNGPHKVLKLEDINNIEDINDFTYNTVQELQNYLQNNEVGQVRVMNDLHGFFANLFNKNSGMRNKYQHYPNVSNESSVKLGQNMD